MNYPLIIAAGLIAGLLAYGAIIITRGKFHRRPHRPDYHQDRAYRLLRRGQRAIRRAERCIAIGNGTPAMFRPVAGRFHAAARRLKNRAQRMTDLADVEIRAAENHARPPGD